ncbi:D-alanyl-D-alanine carboxypeptidase [Oribacterium sp. KHPX15]|uniref:M15 family metallopeptidase n=1 Tax=Oribacterium sp. KHPX15 TaxID=1855342 RepID=UPI00089A0974|nr:M15 family metallopeptidase [Oribacterium sp. KHPX15]SDZ97060.1 D-alanyl-D-alanine carboxypeptidase [Oribacterium sp. KHPX15]
MSNRSRKKPEGYNEESIKIILMLACGLLLLSVILLASLLFVINRDKNKESTEIVVENDISEEEFAAESENNEQMEEFLPGTEPVTITEAETPVETTEETTEETTQEEITTEAPTEPVYLDNLNDYSAGDLINMDYFDFDNPEKYFVMHDITVGDDVYNRIIGKSYRENNYVPLSSLTYITMPHYNFNGVVQMGEIIVSKDVADDVIGVFETLFRNKYEIYSMHLVDNYWTGDPDSTDSASIDVNNTSAFNYRTATGSSKLSNHAYGKAIDINPQQNPYVSYKSGSPKWSHSNANDYIKRDTGLAHVITHDDLAYKVFTEYGFSWGGDWNSVKDYQHFDKN